MEMNGQLHAPAALPPEKDPLVHIGIIIIIIIIIIISSSTIG
jgi:hypothetical protein